MPRSSRTTSIRPVRSCFLVALLATFVVAGCECAVGEPIDTGTDANTPTDTGVDSNMPPEDSGTDTGTDTGMVDSGPVDAGQTCGDGYIDQNELGELCDPGAVGVIDELRCVCPSDNDNCTDDVWVPHPTLGVCFGSCQHIIRTGYGITTCDDGISCTIDTILTGTPATCDVTCSNEPPSDTDTTCNGFDDDCNGMEDDGYVETPTTCGQGICVANGMNTCQGGVVVDTCTPGTAQPNDNNCDGIDQNCNGAADEGYQPIGTMCGVGACASTGTTSCEDGMVNSNCTPGPQLSPTDTTCNNVDDNCNGATDEGYVPLPTSCGQGACMSTGFTSCAAGGIVLNSCVAGTGSAEICDAIDNDCDGTVNDGNPGGGQACPTGLLGVCANGTTNCTGNTIVCNQTTLPSVEVCDGLDNNCDGFVDNIASSSCSTGMPGVCMAGTTACVSGALACVQTTQPSAEVCDALDNNCDGQVNEGNPGSGMGCGTGQLGVCAAGTTSCVGTAIQCIRNTNPSTEVCDGQDNDCDGDTDIDITKPESPNIGNSCGAAGTRTVSIAPTASLDISGNVDVNGDDYITVNFSGAGGPGTYYHPRIQLLNNAGGQYVIEVLNASCSALNGLGCAGNLQTFEMTYPANPNTCLSYGNCSDSTPRVASFIVRVKRSGTGPINCSDYTLRISNQ